jgi:hypothetical protein
LILLGDRLFLAEVSAEPLSLVGQVSHVCCAVPRARRAAGLRAAREQDGDGWDEEEGIQQGLYVTLPAEELTLEGFAEDGRADTMAPGPLLAMVLGAVAGEEGGGWRGCPMTS